MINLLPPEAKKILTHEYIMRVVAVSLLLGSFIFLSLALLSVPTWYLLNMSKSAIGSDLAEAEAAKKEYDQLAKEVSKTNALIDHLDRKRPTFEPSLFISELDTLGGRSIDITEFIFDGQDKLTVSGVADTRAALSVFRDQLETDGRFETVDLPLSSLVNDRDAAFTITLTLK